MSQYKQELELNRFNTTLRFQVPYDVFSTQRIDAGTLFLLDHLPTEVPSSILEIGCGYGALGLPLAVQYPQAQIELVDRDLLAVEACALNAARHHLNHAHIYGSLGYREIRGSDFDWILCNVPARIGDGFITHLITEGLSRLSPNGKILLVVIKPLSDRIERMLKDFSSVHSQFISGDRHDVWWIGGLTAESHRLSASDELNLYFRDEVGFMGLSWLRPHDWGGDDPQRLQSGLPLFFDFMPRDSSRDWKNITCWRSGYGMVPILAQLRWPTAKVQVMERDLLAGAFLNLNQERILHSKQIQIHWGSTLGQVWRSQQLQGGQDLVLGELSASIGVHAMTDELRTVSELLKPRGEALFFGLSKTTREIRTHLKGELNLTCLVEREGYAVTRLFKES